MSEKKHANPDESQPPITEPHHNPQVLYAWKAPSRPYKKRASAVIRFYIALALVLSAIIVFFDPILLIPLYAVLFLFYVLTVTPPHEVEHRVTTFGIETADVVYRWELLSHYYFKHYFGFEVLTLVGNPPYSSHAYLVLPDTETKKHIMSLLSEHIIYNDRPRKTLTDKLVDLLAKLAPDDDVVAEGPTHKKATA